MMPKTGRILSKDAEKWFYDRYSVSVDRGQFTIINRSTGSVSVKRRKYIGVLQYAKNQYASHCRKITL